jgi:gluconolactonase
MVRPNGIAFSPDERWLYVVDTGASHVPNGPRLIRRYGVTADGLGVVGGEDFARSTAGFFDGLRVDTRGHLWVAAGDGVHCHAPDGTMIGKVRVPEVVANVAWGGPKRNRLFICATTSLYAIYVNARGADWPV